MSDKKTPSRRGRPPSLTRDRIAEAGMAMGLPELTFVGVAARLGVSHMALYKHVPSLDALRRLVAEEIFLRHPLPQPRNDENECLPDYLSRFSSSLWFLVETHPGIAPFLLRRDLITPPMQDKITEHQARIAAGFSLTMAQSNRLLFTIAYHCVSVADTVRASSQEGGAASVAAQNEIPPISPDYAFGAQALIVGALALMKETDR